MQKTKKLSTTKKLGVVFTLKQIEAIEKVVETGVHGSTKAKVIETLVTDHLKEHHYLKD